MMSATELVSSLQSGDITAEQALLYFAAMAAEAHRRYNCLTTVMFRVALARARELDRILKETGRPVGPLHGLPVSIKECIAIKGTHATAGIVKFLEEVSQEDAAVITILKAAGAVIYVKSNIPQTMLISDCSNSIYGVTLNPHNSNRTSGGSSGGEGVLVSSGASPLGVGTDIGGSIRMPAAWCGVLGMKPTEGRFTSLRHSPEIFPGLETLTTTCGPIVRCADDAALFYRVMAEYQKSLNVDPTVPPVPFNDEAFSSTRPLVIGYCVSDGHFTASNSAQRAVMQAVDTLKAKGHTLIAFQPHDVSSMVHTFFTFTIGDGVRHTRNLLSGEAVDPCIARTWSALTAPWGIRFAVYSLFKLIGWNRMANILPIWGGSAQYEHQEVRARTNYRNQLIKRMKAAAIDVLLCPGPGIPAPLLNQAQLMAPALAYTFFWNVVKFPAASVPITTVQPDDLKTLRPVKDITDIIANQNDVGSEGMPIPVQVVGLPWTDELVLQVCKQLEPHGIEAVSNIQASMVAGLPRKN
jgi:fatty acid amide hydrolase